jgi:hypothetical protein
MKHINYIMSACVGLLGLTTLSSCDEDFLTVYPTTQIAAGAPATTDVIEQLLTSAYQVLLMDNYANGNIESITLFGDFRSDDLYKGGSDMTDQVNLYYLSQYTSTSVTVPGGWWSIYYTGLQRANGVLQACDNAVNVNPGTLARFKAEGHTLRAYYTHLLWKAWGNIPYYETPLQSPYVAPQLSANEVYAKIIADLDIAIQTPTEDFPMAVSGANTGRLNKAMAMMTKARVVMYQNDQSKYAEVLEDMKTIIRSGHYDLIKKSPDAQLTTNPVEWIFLREGEFCKESIFESNQLPEGKTWGNSWNGYGNYLPKVIGARSLNDPSGRFVDGWGMAPVQVAAYAIFDEAGDCRKDASVIRFAQGTYTPGMQNTGLWLYKYIARAGYNKNVTGDANLNFENNTRIYRLAETYLNAAELSLATGGDAQPYLDAIRDRAFGDEDHRIPATLNNIKLERRKELFGEGFRFWDLVRWGSDENGTPIANVLSVNDPAFQMNRTWTPEKKYLPLPKGEIDKTKGTEFELVQNPGWDN